MRNFGRLNDNGKEIDLIVNEDIRVNENTRRILIIQSIVNRLENSKASDGGACNERGIGVSGIKS